MTPMSHALAQPSCFICVQAILSANTDAVKWLKQQLAKLDEQQRVPVPSSHVSCDWSPKEFLDKRSHYWFNDYENLGSNHSAEEEQYQEVIWKKASSIFVGGSVPTAKAQMLNPALNYLSMNHDQNDQKSAGFVAKLLRNDCQLLSVSLSDVDSHLLCHTIDAASHSQQRCGKTCGVLEHHRLAVQLWDVCNRRKNCDPEELAARKEVVMLMTELDDEGNDSSHWFKVTFHLFEQF